MDNIMSTNPKSYILKSDVVFQPMEEESIIVSLNSEEIFKLNTTGTQIVKLIEEKKSVQEIIDDLVKKFKIDVKEIELEVSRLLIELQKAGLIEEIQINHD